MKFGLFGEQRKTFRISLHEAIFDSVVHHLYEVPCTGRPHVRPAVIGRRRQSFEYWTQSFNRRSSPTNHHAVSFSVSENTAARTDIQEFNSMLDQGGCPSHRVFVVGISSVDDNVMWT